MLDTVTGSAQNCSQILGLNQLSQTVDATISNFTLDDIKIVQMSVVSASDLTNNVSSESMKAQKMRLNFRDYFTYAIVGQLDDPIQIGRCPAECSNQKK